MSTEPQPAIDERRLGMAKLADRVVDFRLGTRKHYEAEGPNNGDMWFFELWHFLGDVEAVLRGEAAAAESRNNSRTAEDDLTNALIDRDKALAALQPSKT